MKQRLDKLLHHTGACIVALALAGMPATAWASSFSDVPDDWYTESIEWIADHGLMTGYADGTFGLGHTLTRAELAEILCRNTVVSSERPDTYPDNSTGMTDVLDKQWYTYAANWAVENHVINGYAGGERFGPNDPVTAEQFVTIVGNYASEDISSKDRLDNLYELADAGYVDAYAQHKVAWALDAGLLAGYPNGDGTRSLRPFENVSRERAAAILANAFKGGIMVEGSNDGDESRAPYVVEYGFSKTEDNYANVAYVIRNPSSIFEASPQVTITGRDASGRVVFVGGGNSTYEDLQPGDTVTYVTRAGNGLDFDTIDIALNVPEYFYAKGNPSFAHNYEITGTSHLVQNEGTDYQYDIFTGEITMKQVIHSAIWSGGNENNAYVRVAYRDAQGRLIGGDSSSVSYLAPGVPAPFEIHASNVPSDMASYEITASNW